MKRAQGCNTSDRTGAGCLSRRRGTALEQTKDAAQGCGTRRSCRWNTHFPRRGKCQRSWRRGAWEP